MTYPNGKTLDYNYTAALDAAISRLTSMSDSTGTLEGFDYLGLGTVVRRSHPEPDVDLTYIKESGESDGDAGDQYTGLDRFGRVVDQRWIDTGTGSHTDRFKYGYDRNSNRLYRENAVNAAFSELYHADGASAGYDNFDQLIEFQRGTLSDTNSDNIPDTVATASRSQGWTLDGQGNWSTLTTDGTGVNRTHNKQNQITAVGTNNLSYDANGNLTTDEIGQQYVYDAWNRFVEVKDSGSTTIAAYEFDALGRRVEETVSGTTRDIYFSAAWQVLEQRVGSDVKVQYVWSPVYVDALVLRDRDADSNAGNGLEERLYVQQDANFNVTALIDTSGSVVERFVYDPFGEPTFLDSSWTTITGGAYDFNILHQGGRYEAATGNYDFRNRGYRPPLGRWLQTDPLGFAAGDTNFYRLVGNNPLTLLDPSGLQTGHIPATPGSQQPGLQSPFGNPTPGTGGFIGNGQFGGLGGFGGSGSTSLPTMSQPDTSANPVTGPLIAPPVPDAGMDLPFPDEQMDLTQPPHNWPWWIGRPLTSLYELLHGPLEPPTPLLTLESPDGGATIVNADLTVTIRLPDGREGCIPIPIGAVGGSGPRRIPPRLPTGPRPGHVSHPFLNDGRAGGQILPRTTPDGTPITYTTVDVHPRVPGVNRGTERVVIGSDGRRWYTDDHYQTFVEVIE